MEIHEVILKNHRETNNVHYTLLLLLFRVVAVVVVVDFKSLIVFFV